MSAAPPGETPSQLDHDLFDQWVAPLFADPAGLPVSFMYDDAQVRGLPENWAPTTLSEPQSAQVVRTVHEGHDYVSGLGMRVEVVQYRDFPVVEWSAWLTNHTGSRSRCLRDLCGLDASLRTGPVVVHHCNGDFDSPNGYSWTAADLGTVGDLLVYPHGGRPCDGAFPYFRLASEGGGLTLAVGWPGQWYALFKGDGTGTSIRSGQQELDLFMEPGETLRTPRMALMTWTGDVSHATNLWRRWYRRHVMPQPGGEPLAPMLSVSGTGEGVEFTGATEENQLDFQDRFARQGLTYDVWWIDAGWYPCNDGDAKNDWTITGSWRPDPARFARGLAPVGAGAHAHGARLLLWFEPERVYPGTDIAIEHPEWVLQRPSGGAAPPSRRHQLFSGLLDLSNPACREWLVGEISRLIEDFGVDVYRQDFNFAPLDYWRAHDADGRRGATENHYVEGYLAFFDALLARHPSLLIDSCASGGRRNDLETMRRAVPLHYTDFGYGNHPVKLDFHRTMFEWLPYFKESSLSWDLSGSTSDGLGAHEGDHFAYHCALAPMFAPAVDIKRDDNDFSSLLAMAGIWRSVAYLLLDGDYYPLTEPGRTGSEWVIWQFNKPEPALEGTGFVQAVRLAKSERSVARARLKALSPSSTYILTECETGATCEESGASLMGVGLTFELPPRSGTIWSYREGGPA